MLLRSSSTPVLGSLLCSFSDSPNNNHYETNTIIKHHLPPTNIPQNHKKLPFGSRNLPSVSCNSSPISPSVADFSDSHRGFRRAQSEGNLQGLAYSSCNNKEDIYDTNQPRKFSARNKFLMLETIPSFSFSNMRSGREDEEDESDIDDEEELEENEELMERNGRDTERIMGTQGGEFSFRNEKTSMIPRKEVKVTDKIRNVEFEWETGATGEEMYLARGLGIGGGGDDGGGGGGGGEFNPADSSGDRGDKDGVEEHYKRMVEENPGNPLFLRNYAQFLYQSKKELQGAEEYYSRAILADPGDGEILSQYAKLVWELHRDEDRASSYFERAIQASPQDSHVHAAYAGFLWETEEDDDACTVTNDLDSMDQKFGGALASASA